MIPGVGGVARIWERWRRPDHVPSKISSDRGRCWARSHAVRDALSLYAPSSVEPRLTLPRRSSRGSRVATQPASISGRRLRVQQRPSHRRMDSTHAIAAEPPSSPFDQVYSAPTCSPFRKGGRVGVCVASRAVLASCRQRGPARVGPASFAGSERPSYAVAHGNFAPFRAVPVPSSLCRPQSSGVPVESCAL